MGTGLFAYLFICAVLCIALDSKVNGERTGRMIIAGVLGLAFGAFAVAWYGWTFWRFMRSDAVR